MDGQHTKYRRLQVDSIWLRTWFEIIAIIAAIAVCSSVVVSGYESSYSAYSEDFTTGNARQLARSVSLIAERGALEIADKQRSEYAAERYCDMLDSCFIGEDQVYSGAIYRVSGDRCELFAQSAGYSRALESERLSDKEDGLDYEVQQLLDAASLGRASYGAFGNSYLAFEPIYDEDGDTPYAVAAAQVVYRTAVAREGSVRSRLIVISIVCGVMIMIYYCVSAARSQKRTREGEVA